MDSKNDSPIGTPILTLAEYKTNRTRLHCGGLDQLGIATTPRGRHCQTPEERQWTTLQVAYRREQLLIETDPLRVIQRGSG
jgi:hypothetical protein